MNFYYKQKKISGWLLIDKPVGLTSFTVVKEVKRVLKVKVGHCGTLDPFATGFILIALGQATKFIKYAMNFKKRYSLTVKWGVGTDSVDSEGVFIKKSDYFPSKDEIFEKCKYFTGNIDQVPPIFSAIKVNGKKACSYIRNQITVQLFSRITRIFSLKILNHYAYKSMFNIECCKGFYIRSLVRDLSVKLNTHTYVDQLRRNLSNEFLSLSMLDYKNDFLPFSTKYNIIKNRILPINYIFNN